MTRLLLVSSDRLLQDCMEAQLRDSGWKAAIERARYLEEAVEVVDRQTVDLVLVDLPRLDDTNLGYLRAVRRQHPQTHVVLRVGASPEGLLDELPAGLRRGVSCCLSHLVSWDHLAHLFHRLLDGRGSETASRDTVPASELFRELNNLGRQRRSREEDGRLDLTPRQRQILALMAQGSSNEVIAEQLGVAISTVKTHAHKMFRRLGVGDRTEAVALGYRKGWL